MEKVLVTGGAGFIGSHFVKRLLRCADVVTVTALDALTYAGHIENLGEAFLSPKLTFVEGDVLDAGLVDHLVGRHTAIVHFAAESHVDRSFFQAGNFVTTNVLGTQTLLDAARRLGTGKVVHVSTDEVYGSIAEGSWTEESPLLPNSPYAASKAGSDLMVLACWRTFGLDVSITRCSNTYGPYQYPEKIIPRFTTRLLAGEPVPVYGSGRNVRDWVHVDDHARGVHLALTRGRAGEVYHLAGGTELTNLDLTHRLLELCGADRSLIRHVADRQGHDLRYSLDDRKSRAELGYAPRRDFDAGLAATVDWYRANTAWWKEIRERMTDRGSVR